MAEGMAHDFNNILAGIVGNLSLAKIDAEPQSRLYSRLCAAEKACARAEEITRRLLTFADGGDPVRRSVRAHEFLATKVLPALNTLPVKVSAEFPEDLPSVCIDADLLSQAFVDLVTDIFLRKGAASLRVEGRCDAGPAPGGPCGAWPRPWIRIALDASDVHLTPRELDRLFDPYAIKDFAVGKGLGPCAAYAVVRRHGGHIQTRCEPGAGTRLIVVLPADGDSQAEDDGGVEGHGTTSFHQGWLLIMDDERIVRETLGEILRLKGYEVALAADGREAVALYTAHLTNGDPFDAVILDLTVRDGPGAVEVLEELRRVDPNVRAFVASGYTMDPVMIDYLRYGFCGVAPKPFHYDELALDIQRIIGRGRKPLP
jgi:CheY-like chemotaxis protein